MVGVLPAHIAVTEGSLKREYGNQIEALVVLIVVQILTHDMQIACNPLDFHGTEYPASRAIFYNLLRAVKLLSGF